MYVICNMSHRLDNPSVWCRDHIRKVLLIYLDVDTKCRAKGRDLHVVPVCASSSHRVQVTLKDTIYFLCSRRRKGDGRRIYPSIFSLRIPSLSSSWKYVDELFVVVGVLTHVFDHASSDLVVIILVPVDLIGKSIKQAVACSEMTH